MKLVGMLRYAINLKIWKICLALYLTIMGMVFFSERVLVIGDWPHDYLKPAYGFSNIQYAWVPSTSEVNSDFFSADFVIAERHFYRYLDEEANLSAYIRSGGAFVSIENTGEFSLIREETVGEGTLLRAEVSGDTSLDSPGWWEASTFWRELFRYNYRHLLKCIAFYSCGILHFLLLGCMVLKAGAMLRSKTVRNHSDFPSQDFSWIKDVCIPSLFLVIYIAGMLYPWIQGLMHGQLLDIEEGLTDTATIKYIGDFLLQNHVLPLNFDFRAYSLPMDISYYQRTLKELPGVIGYLYFHDSMKAHLFAIATYLFLGGLGMYTAARRFCLTRQLAFFVSLLYFAGNNLLAQVMVHGHLIYAAEFALLPWLAWAFFSYFAGNTLKHLLLLLGLLAVMVTYNANIAGVALIAFGLCAYLLYGGAISRRRLILSIIVFIIPFILYIFLLSPYFPFFVSSGMGLADYQYYEMDNWRQAIFLAFANANGQPPAVTLLGFSYGQVLVLAIPFVFSVWGFLSEKHTIYIAIGCIALLLFSMGVYGPFKFFFQHLSLPARAPARTFIPVAAVLILLFAGCGMARMRQHLKNIWWIGGILGIGMLVTLGYSLHIYQSSQHTTVLMADLQDAYKQIPKNSRVLMLPMWGGGDFGFTLSAPQSRQYKQRSCTGYSLVHQHEYIAEENGLKDAFSPPTKWETLKDTGHFYDRLNALLHGGDYDDIVFRTFGKADVSKPNIFSREYDFSPDIFSRRRYDLALTAQHFLLDPGKTTQEVVSTVDEDAVMADQNYKQFEQQLLLAPDLQYLIVYKDIMPQNLLQRMNQSHILEPFYENRTVKIFHVQQSDNRILHLYRQGLFVLSGENDILHNKLLSEIFGKIPIFSVGEAQGDVLLELLADTANKFLFVDGSIRAIADYYAFIKLVNSHEYYVMPHKRKKEVRTWLDGRLRKHVEGNKLMYRLPFKHGEGLIVRMRQSNSVLSYDVTIQNQAFKGLTEPGMVIVYISADYFTPGDNEIVLEDFADVDSLYVVQEKEFLQNVQEVENLMEKYRQQGTLILGKSPSAEAYNVLQKIKELKPIFMNTQTINDENYEIILPDKGKYYVLLNKSYFPLWKMQPTGSIIGPLKANAYLTGYILNGVNKAFINYGQR